MLGQALAAANVTVLTSSSASQTSREDARWQNGAFTKAVLEALGSDDADENKDGLLSATELARYIDRRVRNLTAGGQSPAMEIRSTARCSPCRSVPPRRRRGVAVRSGT